MATEAHDGHSHPEGTKYWDDYPPLMLKGRTE